MKAILLTVSISFVLSSFAFAQEYPKPLLAPGQSQVAGGLGVSWINGEAYYMIGVMPDLQFGPLGVGLDLTLRFDSKTGEIRKVDWSDGAYRKIIRYISWGQKHDPVYAQVGQLSMATLGHGFIMYDYNNSSSFDDRRVGAELDVDFTKFGFETMYGDFQTPGVMGGRAYVRPLKFTPLGILPVVGGLELGATYVTDQNKNSNVIGESAIPPFILIPETKGLMSEYGWDAGLPVLHIPFVDVDLYYDYAQILRYGHGNSLGIQGTFHSLGIVTASAKIEHDWIGDEFIPEYFDQFYELDRYNPGNPLNSISKTEQLDSVKVSSGWFGQITIAVLGKFQIIGNYRGIDHDPQGGLLHLETQFPNVIPVLTFSAGYDRHTNNTLKDAFIIGDSRSLLYAFVGYKPYPFMTVGLNYYYTFVPENGTYQIQRRIEPRVMFNFTF